MLFLMPSSIIDLGNARLSPETSALVINREIDVGALGRLQKHGQGP